MLELLAYCALGSVVGALSAFLGIGGGVILVTALVAIGDFSQHEAQATALAFMVPTALVGIRAVRQTGIGDLRTSAVLGATGALGAVAGAVIALALSGEVLRYLFATFLALVGMSMLLRSQSEDRPRPSRRHR